jgi:hypothetical protein
MQRPESLEPRTLLAAVTDVLVPAGATWRYLDTGANAGTAWTAPTFNDSAWRTGAAQLGDGDGDEATVVRSGPSTNRYITTYFRHSFTATEIRRYAALSLELKRDDGAVVYLNGREVARSNMPSGAVGYRTRASTNVAAAAESTFYGFAHPPRCSRTGPTPSPSRSTRTPPPAATSASTSASPPRATPPTTPPSPSSSSPTPSITPSPSPPPSTRRPSGSSTTSSPTTSGSSPTSATSSSGTPTPRFGSPSGSAPTPQWTSSMPSPRSPIPSPSAPTTTT